MALEIITFDKSLQKRLIEFKEILSGRGERLPSSHVKNEWRYNLEETMELAGWNALWKISRQECQELSISFPTFVMVTVSNVDFINFTGEVHIVAIQDNIDLLETHIVPLLHLFPTVQQDSNMINVENTANCLDQFRIIDIKNGAVPPEMVSHICSLIQEGKALKQKIDIWQELLDEEEDSPSDIANEDRTCLIMESHLRLDQITAELKILENPDLRNLMVRKKQQETKSVDPNECGEVCFVWQGGTVDDLIDVLTTVKTLIQPSACVNWLQGLSVVIADPFSELRASIRWIGGRTRCPTAPAQHHTLVAKWAGLYERPPVHQQFTLLESRKHSFPQLSSGLPGDLHRILPSQPIIQFVFATPIDLVKLYRYVSSISVVTSLSTVMSRHIIRDCIQETPSVHVTQYVINRASLQRYLTSPSLEDTLGRSVREEAKTIFLCAGTHEVQRTVLLERGLVLRGISNFEKTVLMTKSNCAALLDNCVGELTLEHVTLDCRLVQLAIMVRVNVRLRGCRVVDPSGFRWSQGIVVIEGASFEATDCEFFSLGTAVVVHSGANAILSACNIRSCLVGVLAYGGANVSLVKSSIIDCKEYGIKFETNRCSEVNLKPKIGAIDLLESVEEVSISDCILSDNVKGDVQVVQQLNLLYDSIDSGCSFTEV
uniref:Right handed beta helix domain-containing protein n=1 Tax=Timema tahoe TaxID=61484 RepID=A0A7R9NWV0_9NEOP|nr:unnamed protein product [Timema tahoe]